MLDAGDYAGVRYQGPRSAGEPGGAGHVESYFLKANDRAGRRAIWLKATILATARLPQVALAEAWAVAFDRESGHVVVKQSVPFEQAAFDPHRLRADVAGCDLSAGRARGALETGGRRVAWDLTFDALAPPLHHFPHRWMYDGAFPSAKLTSPFPDIRVFGSVVVNGERWSVDSWPGMVGHNWGRRHAEHYAWAHVNSWEDSGDFSLEATSARTKTGPILAPMLTLLCLRHRGVRYELNGALDIARNRGEISGRRYRFVGENAHASVTGELWGETDDFVGLHYENPSGPPAHCVNTKLAHARVELALRGGPASVFHSRTGALEIGAHDPDHGVRVYA